MKLFRIFAMSLLMTALACPSQAQFLKNLGNALTGKSTQSSQSSSSSSNSSSAQSASAAPAQASSSQATANSGKVYYVKTDGASRGADGLSVATAKKDIQAVLNIIKENNENGAVIRVAEGNYLGAMNSGYIEISNWVTLEGGWNSDFTERDPLKYITRIEPTQDQLGTNGSKGLITISKLDDVMAKKPKGNLVIDGIMMNMGLENYYMPNDPSDERNGCPSKAYETGLLRPTPPQVQHQIMFSEGWIAGNVTIKNCLILNGNNFGIQISTRCGEVEIYNCVFVSNRMSAVRIQGGDKNGEASHINFHHNTVAFSWCRDKIMEDMGYGYEFMTLVSADVHHNIFVGNNYAAVARTHALSGPDAPIEAKRITNLYDNYYFLNAADLQLPSKGGGKWTNVKCTDILDMVDEKVIPNADNNLELPSGDAFIKALDQDYLTGFANLKVISSSQNFNPNSASNQFRQAMGQNMQGTEIHRVSMYGNRYNFDKAMQLFGAKAGYGAQKP
ncbi:MAG: right-handed parallel beta-helix repeat-containing protein [Paludibacteraceae bacterium]|nr:right-handed parallel beta-helix repeat-containing protein [Paludibacteraceae bacterium]